MGRHSVIRAAVAAAAVAALATGGAAGCKVREAAAPGDATEPARASWNAPRERAPGSEKHGSSDAKPSVKQPPRPKSPAGAPPRREPAPLMATGTTSGQVRELQARLASLSVFDRGPTGYYGPVTTASVQSFQAMQGLARTGTVDSVTWARLLALTHRPSYSAMYPPTRKPPAAPDPRCLTGRVLCVSKTSSTLSWMIDGRVVSSMDVRFGSQYTPTREGTFTIGFKSRNHVSTIYHTPMPYAMFFSGGQAVHYSADFAARGYRGASHGCVNVRDEGRIASLFAQVRSGDKVVIHR
ncbi:L,D-transpeptidase family protein [Streptomyces sp. NPDC004647]|uniref:L,D-transpeptidase family protein n=1 Tax=Streptomyces sp. NPDC004647 TaxID=3154671 RepID=UPI0033B9F53D